LKASLALYHVTGAAGPGPEKELTPSHGIAGRHLAAASKGAQVRHDLPSALIGTDPTGHFGPCNTVPHDLEELVVVTRVPERPERQVRPSSAPRVSAVTNRAVQLEDSLPFRDICCACEWILRLDLPCAQ
jgi:hypothetical protein